MVCAFSASSHRRHTGSWGLRDYGTATWEGGSAACDHKQWRNGAGADGIVDDRGKRSRDGVGSMGGDCRKCGARRIDQQLGLEPTMQEFVANMVDVFSLVWELLADDGVCWVNLGDSYNNSDKWGGGGNTGKHTVAEDGSVPSWAVRDRKANPIGLKPKDLCGIPWRVAFALQEAGWWLRQDIIWSKPSPMPESVTDRCTKSHEYVFLLSKRGRYFFDAEAIKEQASNNTHERKASTPAGWNTGPGAHTTIDGRYSDRRKLAEAGSGIKNKSSFDAAMAVMPETRNKRSVWTVASQPYSEAHFATFPEALIAPMILAGTSQRGHCPACLARWVRVLERESFGKAPSATKYDDTMQAGPLARSRQAYRAAGLEGPPAPKTIGWKPSCQCDLEPAQDIVFDPFMGSGTTARVAEKLGRRWLGCELQRDYEQMQKARTAQMSMALS